MKRTTILTLVAALLLLNSRSVAQKTAFLAIKGSLSGVCFENYKMALEWKQTEHFDLEISGSYHQHQHLGSKEFSGQILHDYALRHTYYSGRDNPALIHDAGWQYLGDGRPVENPSEASEIDVSTIRLNLGLRKSSYWGTKGLQYFYQTGITIALHETYQTSATQTTLQRETFNNWQVSEAYFGTWQAVHTSYYTQSQAMRFKKYWIGGPATQFGLSWHTPKGLIIETSCTIAVNIGGSKLPDTETINELRLVYGQLDVMVGYRFPLKQAKKIGQTRA